MAINPDQKQETQESGIEKSSKEAIKRLDGALEGTRPGRTPEGKGYAVLQQETVNLLKGKIQELGGAVPAGYAKTNVLEALAGMKKKKPEDTDFPMIPGSLDKKGADSIARASRAA